MALLQAAQQQALASLDGRALDWSGTKLIDYTREQVGAALRLSPGTAEHRLSLARTLVERLPATLELLRTGQLTYLHAMKLADAVTAFDAEATAKIEQRVLARAAQQTLSQFGASLRRAVIAADPRRAEQRHEDALATRRVVFTPQDDGITELWALLPADGAALIEAVLNSQAIGQTDDRTADQRRADALVDVFARVLADPSLPEAHGQRPVIQVTVAISTLLGCDEQPADLDGYGSITAAMARRIAADESGTWRRLVTDEAGQLLDYGRKPTGHPPTSPTTSSPGTRPAPSRDVDGEPGCAISITVRPGATAGRLAARTWRRSVNVITTRSTTRAGESNTDLTESTSGPAQPGSAMWRTRLTASSEHPGGRAGPGRRGCRSRRCVRRRQ